MNPKSSQHSKSTTIALCWGYFRLASQALFRNEFRYLACIYTCMVLYVMLPQTYSVCGVERANRKVVDAGKNWVGVS